MQSIESYNGHIRTLSDFKTSNLRIEAQRAGTLDSRHAKPTAGGQNFRAVQCLLQQRSGAHLCKHVEAVVTRRTIGSERNRNSLFEQLRDRRDAGAEF